MAKYSNQEREKEVINRKWEKGKYRMGGKTGVKRWENGTREGKMKITKGFQQLAPTVG